MATGGIHVDFASCISLYSVSGSATEIRLQAIFGVPDTLFWTLDGSQYNVLGHCGNVKSSPGVVLIFEVFHM